MPSRIYRLICILDSVASDDQTISSMDASPDYLHIHILDSSYLRPLEEALEDTLQGNVGTDNALYQWGTPFEKDTHTRSTKVSAEEIKNHGQIGIGSASRGNNEMEGDFIGGGEAFLFNSQNFRLTKGNEIFSAADSQKYWAFQTANFSNAVKIDDLSGSTISGRRNLMDILKEKSNSRPFVATFDAEFHGKFFTRSNGIFPEDLEFVREPELSLFDDEIKGGHLVGGNDNPGDVKSLQQKFSSEEEIKEIDFSLRILSPIFLKPLNELKIAKRNGTFRSPRTEIEVNGAAQLIQEKWKEYRSK